MKRIRDGMRKVMVAEKDEEVRHLLSEFLKLQGFAVEEFDRPGRMPVEKLEPPDLFLLGHGSSEEETFEVLDDLRARRHFEGVPVIVIAVDPDEGFTAKAASRGADSLLPFPFPLEVLQERIRDLLDGRPTSLIP